MVWDFTTQGEEEVSGTQRGLLTAWTRQLRSLAARSNVLVGILPTYARGQRRNPYFTFRADAIVMSTDNEENRQAHEEKFGLKERTSNSKQTRPVVDENPQVQL